MKLLLVEDDTMIAEGLQSALKHSGYSIDWVNNGEDASDAINDNQYDLIILDMGLPKKPGINVLKDMRLNHNEAPVIVLTAQDAISNRVEGLDSGADDYMVKPFALEELEARIRLLLRRKENHHTNELVHDNITLDMTSRSLKIDGKVHSLSAKEYSILYALIKNPSAVISRSELEDQIYGWNEEIGSNAIEVHIHQIRQKFGKSVIKNIRGLGYSMGSVQ